MSMPSVPVRASPFDAPRFELADPQQFKLRISSGIIRNKSLRLRRNRLGEFDARL
jgi:hypothetical protein